MSSNNIGENSEVVSVYEKINCYFNSLNIDLEDKLTLDNVESLLSEKSVDEVDQLLDDHKVYFTLGKYGFDSELALLKKTSENLKVPYFKPSVVKRDNNYSQIFNNIKKELNKPVHESFLQKFFRKYL